MKILTKYQLELNCNVEFHNKLNDIGFDARLMFVVNKIDYIRNYLKKIYYPNGDNDKYFRTTASGLDYTFYFSRGFDYNLVFWSKDLDKKDYFFLEVNNEYSK